MRGRLRQQAPSRRATQLGPGPRSFFSAPLPARTRGGIGDGGGGGGVVHAGPANEGQQVQRPFRLGWDAQRDAGQGRPGHRLLAQQAAGLGHRLLGRRLGADGGAWRPVTLAVGRGERPGQRAGLQHGLRRGHQARGHLGHGIAQVTRRLLNGLGLVGLDHQAQLLPDIFGAQHAGFQQTAGHAVTALVGIFLVPPGLLRLGAPGLLGLCRRAALVTRPHAQAIHLAVVGHAELRLDAQEGLPVLAAPQLQQPVVAAAVGHIAVGPAREKGVGLGHAEGGQAQHQRPVIGPGGQGVLRLDQLVACSQQGHRVTGAPGLAGRHDGGVVGAVRRRLRDGSGDSGAPGQGHRRQHPGGRGRILVCEFQWNDSL